MQLDLLASRTPSSSTTKALSTAKNLTAESALIRIDAFVRPFHATNSEDQLYFAVVAFIDRRGKRRATIVPASLLEKPKSFVEHLADRGFDWRQVRKSNDIIEALRNTDAPVDGLVTSVPGWHASAYCRGDRWIAKTPPNCFFQPCATSVKMGAFLVRGSLKSWKKHVARYARWSTRMRLFISLPFAATILKLIGARGFGVVAVGRSSIGKTLLLQMAASVTGLIGPSGVTSLSSSIPDVEEMVLGHRDGFLPLDEVGHIFGDSKKADEFLKALSFQAGSARGRGRAAAYERAVGAVKADTKVIVGLSSEISLAAIARRAGRSRMGGEEVRLLEPAAISEGADDIFDLAYGAKPVGSTVEDRRAVVENIERACIANQGVAHVVFLERLVEDTAAADKAQAYVAEFMKAAADILRDRSAGRVGKEIASAYAGARLAIEYGVLPWGRGRSLAALLRCLSDILKHSHCSADRSDDEIVTEFVNRLRKINAAKASRVSNPKPEKRGAMQEEDAIIMRTKRHRASRLCIKAKRLREWYPAASTRTRLLRLLISRGIMEPGRNSSTSTRELQFVGLNPVRGPFYVVVRPRIEEIEKKANASEFG
jgi:hypothetical protein